MLARYKQLCLLRDRNSVLSSTADYADFHRFLLSPGLQTKTKIPKIGVFGRYTIATDYCRFVPACMGLWKSGTFCGPRPQSSTADYADFHRFLLFPGLQTKTKIPKIGVFGGYLLPRTTCRFVPACMGLWKSGTFWGPRSQSSTADYTDFHRFLLSPGLQIKIPKIGVIGGYLLLRNSADWFSYFSARSASMRPVRPFSIL
jgi:hypothetical protein